MSHTIKGLRAQFKAVGKFHTPPELALRLRSHIPGTPGRVYDPTCGAGALLSVFPDDALKFGQDIDGAALADAELLPHFTGHLGDVLTDPAWVNERFDAIVANPPFSIEWTPVADERFFGAPTIPTKGRADFAFLLHIVWMLAEGGTAAVLQFPGVCYRGGREKTLREWLTRQNLLHEVHSIPEKTFEDTSIATVVLVLRKGRTTQTARFVDGDRETLVTLDDIEAQDWSWAPSTYIPPVEPEREPFDAWETEQAARRNAVKKLRAELSMSRMVANFEGWPITPFYDALEAVITEARA